ncbi:hypothetical protein [Georgenia sp. SYP-B2076]|uniref:hypothetical protein n=1 Tax=Georgenia sp. SYP-B2076 TaxID=2495881 RepID=UPI000F8C430C|nr:hypothetical protein [Georgenia sp. SYP-B2076]
MSDIEIWESELRTTGQVRLSTSRRHNVLALLGCLAFTAVGVALARESLFVAVLAVGFFGVIGIPVMIVQLVKPRDVVVTATEVRFTSGLAVPWQQVAAVEIGALQRQTMILLRMTPDGAPQVKAQYGAVQRALAPANDGITGGPTVTLPVQLRADKAHLGAWLTGVHYRAVMNEPDAEIVLSDGDDDTDDDPTSPGDDTRFMPPEMRPPRP